MVVFVVDVVVVVIVVVAVVVVGGGGCYSQLFVGCLLLFLSEATLFCCSW